MSFQPCTCTHLMTYTNLPLCHTQTGNTDIICVTLSISALCDDVKGGEMARCGHSGEFMHPEMSLHRGATGNFITRLNYSNDYKFTLWYFYVNLCNQSTVQRELMTRNKEKPHILLACRKPKSCGRSRIHGDNTHRPVLNQSTNDSFPGRNLCGIRRNEVPRLLR